MALFVRISLMLIDKNIYKYEVHNVMCLMRQIIFYSSIDNIFYHANMKKVK
jgi:hypothetical protein